MIAAAAAAAAAGSQLMVANEVAMGERQACERLCVLHRAATHLVMCEASRHLFYRFSKAPANEKRPSDYNGLLAEAPDQTPNPRWFGQLVLQ